MQLIPLYKPEALLNAWPTLTKGLERVLEFSNGDDDLTRILNQALGGELLVWMVMDDSNRYVGFTTTCIRTVGTQPVYKYLVFDHTYKVPGADFESFIGTFFGPISDFAKRQGCTSLKLYSLRPLKKMVAAYGFKPSYTEYVKELDK